MEVVKIRRFEEADLDGVFETIQKALETAVLAKIYEPADFEI